MQITIKSTRIIKEGFQSNGTTPYKWVSVIADDGSEKGTEYTTFDAGVLKLGPGSVIDIGDIETKEGKLKFKKVVSVISELKATAPAPNGKTYPDMSKEEWREKQLIERASFEAQTAFKGIIDLLVAKIILPEGEIAQGALDWASKRLSPTLQEVVATMPHLGRPADESGPRAFKNVGDFLTAMGKKGLSRKQVIDELIRLKMIKGEADLPKLDLTIAWEALGDAITPEDIPF